MVSLVAPCEVCYTVPEKTFATLSFTDKKVYVCCAQCFLNYCKNAKEDDLTKLKDLLFHQGRNCDCTENEEKKRE